MKNKIILLIIISIAILFRFWMLGQNPPSLTWDEAAWGYNAYSMGIDGKDEFGRFLPLDYLESFGDFKPPVYAYLDVLPVKIFGLNEFAVRFPSALFGVLTVLMTYFLTRRIFSSQHSPPRSPSPLRQGFAGRVGHLGGGAWRLPRGEIVALLSAFFLAISPWHIMLSRAAFEANVATFFIVLGIWLFLLSMHGKRWILLFSGVSFIFSMYTFNTARIVVPLLILGLAIGFRKELLQMRKQLLITSIIGVILILPLAQFLTTPQAKLRFQEVNIFSDIGVIENVNQQIENDNNSFISKVIHNRRFVFAASYLNHYFDNLSPDFLFIKGDGNPKFSTQTVGQMYLWELPFFIIGILYLIRRKEGHWWVIPLWLILGIIPAGTARETPHALRIETTLPTFQILTAYGLVQVFRKVSSIKHQVLSIKAVNLFAICYLLFAIFNFLYFFHDYLVHYPRIYSGEWQYGYKESIKYVSDISNRYDIVEVTTDLGRPYIYYLFYTKNTPGEFRKTADVEREVFGFVNVKGYDKYRFLKDLKIVTNEKILYVNSAQNTPKNAKILKTFYLLNGDPILKAYSL